MSDKAKIARQGDKKSINESRIATGGNQKPFGDMKQIASSGGQIPLNPNASQDKQGVGTH